MSPTAPLSRRRLLALTGAASVLLAGCGADEDPDKGATQATNARRGADVEVLNAVRDGELEALAFHRAAQRALQGEPARTVRAVAAQLSQHADGLAQAIRDLDGSANKTRGSYRFPPLDDPDAVLSHAVVLADRIVAAYVDAIPKLGDPRLRGTAAAIVTSVAEQALVLRAARGDSAQPQELVVGRA